MIGDDIEKGLLPNDLSFFGKMVEKYMLSQFEKNSLNTKTNVQVKTANRTRFHTQFYFL